MGISLPSEECCKILRIEGQTEVPVALLLVSFPGSTGSVSNHINSLDNDRSVLKCHTCESQLFK
jgi:hypothetical protein